MAKFEGQERRMSKIEAALKEYGMTSLEEARDLCLSKGIDVESIVKGVQHISSPESTALPMLRQNMTTSPAN